MGGRTFLIKEYRKEYRKKNKEKISEYNRKYYKENLLKMEEKNRRFRENNPNYSKERYSNNCLINQCREYRKNNPEKISETNRKYRKNNEEKIKKSNKIYYLNNLEKIKQRYIKKRGELKERIPWNKGKTGIYTEDTLKKMSESRRGKKVWNKGKTYPQFSGVNSNNWKGGITPLRPQIINNFKYRQWRSDVFTRDDFICQECGQKGGKLNAHHIKSFSSILQYYEITTLKEALDCEELWNINNGITFCRKCHQNLHKGIIKIYEQENMEMPRQPLSL